MGGSTAVVRVWSDVQRTRHVPRLLAKLYCALSGIAWRESSLTTIPDGTWQVVRQLAQPIRWVRCLRRTGGRGLSGACIEGILASSAPFVAVMDADLQHDENTAAQMLALLEAGEAELAVAAAMLAAATPAASAAPGSAAAPCTLQARRLLHIRSPIP